MSDQLTHETAKTLLHKLSTDDRFREQLLGDPAGALASVGVKVDPASVPHVRSLPSKAEVQANAEALHAKLQGNAGMAIFLLV